MNQNPLTTPANTSSQSKSGCGCFLTGCLTLILILGVVIGIIYYQLRSMYSTYLNEYTTASGIAVPESTLAPEKEGEVLGRGIRFRDALEHGEKTAPLVLSGAEVQAFVSPFVRASENMLRLNSEIIGDEFRFVGSAQLPELGDSNAVRFLNASGSIHLDYKNETLTFELRELNANEKAIFAVASLPIRKTASKEEIQESLRRNESEKDQRLAERLDQIESLEMRNGQLIITPKAAFRK